MENTQLLSHIIIFIIILSIYLKFDSIFQMILYLIDNNFYMYSMLNLGYAPLSAGNDCPAKHSNELYTRILSNIEKHINLNGKVLVETPCISRNSIYILSQSKTFNKYICISPYKSNVDFVNQYELSKNLSYIYGQTNQLATLKLPKKIDCCLTVEAVRIGYSFKKLSKQISSILNKGSFWVIADLLKADEVKTIQNNIKSNKFKIKDVNNISNNVIESLNCDSSEKQKYLSTLPIIKEQLSNLFYLKNSTNYNKLITQEYEYLIMIFEKI